MSLAGRLNPCLKQALGKTLGFSQEDKGLRGGLVPWLVKALRGTVLGVVQPVMAETLGCLSIMIAKLWVFKAHERKVREGKVPVVASTGS